MELETQHPQATPRNGRGLAFDFSPFFHLFERLVAGIERMAAVLERPASPATRETVMDGRGTDGLLTVRQVAQRLSCSTSTVLRRVENGRLPAPAWKDGQVVRWDAGEIDEAVRLSSRGLTWKDRDLPEGASSDGGPKVPRRLRARRRTGSDRKCP